MGVKEDQANKLLERSDNGRNARSLSQRQLSVAQQQFLDVPDDGTMVACTPKETVLHRPVSGFGLLGLTCLPANNFWGRVDSQKLQVKADVPASSTLLVPAFLSHHTHITSILAMSYPTLHLRAEVRFFEQKLAN